MGKDTRRFGFGKNWQRFIEKNFNEERIEISRKHILGFLKMNSLEGRYFLDVGCGSGLHSLGALRAGAEKIVSFDLDIDCVQTTEKLREFSGSPRHWTVSQGSILDEDFIAGIGPADIVYSWGVLHHTGDMWKAIENTANLMRDNSLLYMALYDYDVFIDPPPEFWLAVKKRYNEGAPLTKRWIELWYVCRFILGYRPHALPGQIRLILKHRQTRGMAFYTDIKDWLGGWPMEFAKVDDVKHFCGEKLRLDLVNINSGEANSEYLFKKGNPF
jgi:SAM-dependent methyltransferase